MRKQQIHIKTGQTYGEIEVISVHDEKPKSYDCKCLRCGSSFVMRGADIYKLGMCRECSRKEAIEKKEKSDNEKYAGKRFGQVNVIKVLPGRKGIRALCQCDCGNTFETRASNLLTGNTTTCGHNRQGILNAGRGQDLIAGTSKASINRTREKNQNNSSGITGVSLVKSGNYAGKWRAYIGYKGKRYELGCFHTFEEAVAARKAGEDKYYRGEEFEKQMIQVREKKNEK